MCDFEMIIEENIKSAEQLEKWCTDKKSKLSYDEIMEGFVSAFKRYPSEPPVFFWAVEKLGFLHVIAANACDPQIFSAFCANRHGSMTSPDGKAFLRCQTKHRHSSQ